jgi:hypothetical protein
MKAPDSAASVISSGFLVLMMSVCNTISSSDYPVFLAVTCLMAVRNDIGLNSAEIHNDFGAIKSVWYSTS